MGTWGTVTFAAAVAVAAVGVASAADLPGDPAASCDTRIRQLVEELGYPPEVGDRCVTFADGFPTARWRESLAAAEDRVRQGVGIPAAVEAENRVIDELRRRLDAVIRQDAGDSSYWNLGDVLAAKRAQCLGNCQLWHVLGSAVGLRVAAIEVSRPADGALAEHETHVATLVRLADGRVRMIDTRYGIASGPFRFAEAYRQQGTTWARASLGGDRRLPRRVRPLDRGGLEAAILLNIGNTYRRAGQEQQAAAIYDRAVRADPDSAVLQLAVAETRLREGRWDDAERSIQLALEIDPEAGDAHAALGRLLMRENRWGEAVAAFDRAIALKPDSPAARRSRSEARERMAPPAGGPGAAP